MKHMKRGNKINHKSKHFQGNQIKDKRNDRKINLFLELKFTT